MFNPQEELEIKTRLSGLSHDVKLILFSQTFNCQTCQQTEVLIKALVPLSEKLKLEVYNPHIDREKAQQYGVSETPTLILEGDKDYGIRYLGMPGGYEFASLLEDLISIGSRESGLSEATKDKLSRLEAPIHLKVFVTPT